MTQSIKIDIFVLLFQGCGCHFESLNTFNFIILSCFHTLEVFWKETIIPKISQEKQYKKALKNVREGDVFITLCLLNTYYRTFHLFRMVFTFILYMGFSLPIPHIIRFIGTGSQPLYIIITPWILRTRYNNVAIGLILCILQAMNLRPGILALSPVSWQAVTH